MGNTIAKPDYFWELYRMQKLVLANMTIIWFDNSLRIFPVFLGNSFEAIGKIFRWWC
ncbi:MAG: hypothetical protein F6K40_15240 [Okeania sp. SIO3I5]|uniref:hypothetical protein n=1 Tax=Okeania sp. SIO3I5 TaxID=2607805 RepID=UPI0013B9F9F7|nr:hypothetical protein [Okeania sp. SIO3I5]NEQ37548.1 hypothetical protein [Okeania sp. SIO3I5]